LFDTRIDTAARHERSPFFSTPLNHVSHSEKYWRSQDGALQQRWREFLAVSVPFLTKVVAMLVRGGVDELKKNDASLARYAPMPIVVMKSISLS
jgi:hypothetical protein